jgi:hypothetical protein
MEAPEGFTLLPYTDTSGFEPKETTVYVTTLPKGTVLFRGINKPPKSGARTVEELRALEEQSTLEKLYSDLYGIRTKDRSYCLPPEYNVFFYPFPFADASVADLSYTHVFVYVTLRDIKLATFIFPSPMRQTDKGPATSCNELPTHGCGLSGRRYDPCFKPDFRADHPDVSGMIDIVDMDRKNFQNIVYNYEEGSALRTYFNKYVSLYTDDKFKSGIPELILHPLVARGAEDTVTPRGTNVEAWYDMHEDTASYAIWRVIPRDDKSILAFMEESTGSGVDGLRIKLDTRTGFYVREADADAETKAHLVDVRTEGGDWAMSKDIPGFRFRRGAIDVLLTLKEIENKAAALGKSLATDIRNTYPRTKYANRIAYALSEAILHVMVTTLGYYDIYDENGHEVKHDTICEDNLKACGLVLDGALATLPDEEEGDEEEVVGETKDFAVMGRPPIDNATSKEQQTFAKWHDIIQDRLLDASFDPKTGRYDRPKMIESAAQLISQVFSGSVDFALKTMVANYPETDEPARDFLTKSLEQVEELLTMHNDYGDPGWINFAFDHPYGDGRWVDWTDEYDEEEEEEEEDDEEEPPTGARRRRTYRRRKVSLRRRR